MVIGTCSNCGGPVTVATFVINPVPTCKMCRATAKEPYGPVVQMNPAPEPRPERQAVEDYMRAHPDVLR